MKLKAIIAVLVLVVLAAGFVLLAASEVPVKPVEVRKTIPNEQFFQKN